MKDKVLKILAGFKWPVVVVSTCCLVVFVGTSLFCSLYPLEKHREQFLTYLSQISGAQKVHVESISWASSLRNLSVGIVFSDVIMEKVGAFERIRAPQVELSLQPLKVIFGRLPVFLKIRADEAVLKNLVASKDAIERPQEEEESSRWVFPEWMKRVRLLMDVQISNLLSSNLGSQENVFLNDLRLNGVVSGIPGHFQMSAEGRWNINMENPSWSARGPAHWEVEGYFQTEGGRPVGMRMESFSIDLSQSTLAGLGFIEKPGDVALKFHSQIQLIFNTSFKVKTVEFLKSQLLYDNVAFDISGEWDRGSPRSLQWSLGKKEVENLRLPLVGFRLIPVKGILETSGSLHFSEQRVGTGDWRLSFNNIEIKTSDIPGEGRVSRGILRFSIMSEGAIRAGRVSSPRTEIQVDGTQAEVNFFKGRLQKPMGKPLEVLAKFQIQDDQLTVSEFKGVLSTAHLQGAGHIKDLSEFLSGHPTDFRLDLSTNRIDISKYSIFFPLFRKPPAMEGFFEFAGVADGKIQNDAWNFSQWNWRVDRLNLSNFKTVIDRESVVQLGLDDGSFQVNGPLAGSVLFKGRGFGGVIGKGLLMGRIDLTPASLAWQEYSKPADVPFYLDVSSVMNRRELTVRRGEFRLDEFKVLFDGVLSQGSKQSAIEIRLAKPFPLADLNKLIRSDNHFPWKGSVGWEGRLVFRTPSTIMESNFDWKSLSIEGHVKGTALSFPMGRLKSPVKEGTLSLLLTPDAVVLENFKGRMGQSQVFASGELQLDPGRRAKNAGNLNRWLEGKGWRVQMALSADRLADKDFAIMPTQTVETFLPNVQPKLPSFGEQVREFLDRPHVRSHEITVNFRSGPGEWKGLAFRSLNMKAQWKNDVFQWRPLALEALGGKIMGDMRWEASPYFDRKDPPLFSATLHAQGLDLNQGIQYFEPSLGTVARGRFEGDLIFSGQGFSPEEIKESLRGRMQGIIQGAHVQTLDSAQGLIGVLAESPVLKERMAPFYSREACSQKNWKGSVDIQFERGGSLRFSDSKMSLGAGAQISWSGTLDASQQVKIHGSFIPGNACLEKAGRECFLSVETERAGLPFDLSGVATHPEMHAETEKLSRRIASCLDARAAARAKTRLQQNTSNSLEEEARKALQGF